MENNLFNYLLIPEIFFTILILLLILIGLFKKSDSFKSINLLSCITLFFVFILVFLDINISSSNYNYFFINNFFINFFKFLIIFGCFSSLIITKKYFIDVKLISFEIPILILFSCLGMMIMISSNNLISMYLGIELQSLALYVLAAIKRDSIQSSESGVKYFILGALSSGILLYGCSLIYGFTGTTNFSEIYNSLLSIKSLNLGLIFGLVFVLVGLAFKVSAVPFHMWTPDVYEGAPTSITAFFAIVPKISAVVLIYRFCMEPFYHFYSEWSQIIIFLSIASMFLGAIAAISQKNIKRLLAYSSIGHVGYILIGVAAFISNINPNGPSKVAGIQEGDVILKFNNIQINKMTNLPRVVAESDVGSVAIVELWRKNKIISIEVKLGELPEESFVERKNSKNENDKEIFALKNLDLSIKDSKENFGVIVVSVNPNSNLQEGDIIKEVNREVVNNSKEFIDLINNIEKTGRGSLLLKIQREDQSLWVTIKFVK